MIQWRSKGPRGHCHKKGEKEENKKKKLVIFMQQMQYNAPIRMHVFQNFYGGDTPGPPFGAVSQNRAPLLQNPGCAFAVIRHEQWIDPIDIRATVLISPYSCMPVISTT